VDHEKEEKETVGSTGEAASAASRPLSQGQEERGPEEALQA
jgi:hypothetical protein